MTLLHYHTNIHQLIYLTSLYHPSTSQRQNPTLTNTNLVQYKMQEVK